MFYHKYEWPYFGAEAVFLVYLIYRFVQAQKNKPHIAKTDIVYQEWFASGHSEANTLMKLGGASNCVRLIATANVLVVTSWFPFSLFSAFYDMEHVIPLTSISRVEQRRSFGMGFLLLVYQDNQGRTRKIGLMPRDQKRFLEAIGQRADMTA